jgi:hypothetical protein
MSRPTRLNLAWSISSIHAARFQVKDLTRLFDVQKGNGPLLFNLMGQCFQGVGLTKWTSVIAK